MQAGRGRLVLAAPAPVSALVLPGRPHKPIFTTSNGFCVCPAGSPLRDRLQLAAPAAVAALIYTQVAHIPIEQILNGAIAAVLFNIIYDLVLSSKLRWYALASVIDSINHSSFSQVSLPAHPQE